MQFLYPQAFWLALSVPGILAFYFLRPRRRQGVVPSTLLWRSSSVNWQASRPWQRLRPQLLLFLQLLAALLITLAAAHPVWQFGSAAGSTIVLLDASASMQARDTGQTRFEQAKAQVEALASGLKRGATITVIAFDRLPRVVLRGCGNPGEVERALRDLKPSSCRGELGPALTLARALARDEQRPRLVLISDGGLDPQGMDTGTLDFLQVGSREPSNVALASLDLRPVGTGQAAQVLVIDNGARPASGKVFLTAGGEPQEALAWRLEPGKATHLLWPRLPSGVPVAARLEVDRPDMDQLALDNQAWAVTGPERRARLLLVTPGNIFLERVLEVIPDLDVYRVTPEEYRKLVAGAYPYEITVLDGVVDPLPPGALLAVNPPPGNWLGLGVGGLIHPASLTQNADSPLLRYADPSQFGIASARELTLTGNWMADIASGGKAVLAHGEFQGRRVAVWGFDMHDSDLPLRPAFPVLVYNLVTWLLPPNLDVPPAVQPGQEVTVATLPLAQEVAVETPAGNRNLLAPPFPSNPWVPSEPGLYRIVESWTTKAGGRVYPQRVSGLVVVNAYDAQESDLRLRDPRPGSGPGGSTGGSARLPRPLTGALAGVLLAVIIMEWAVASRGR